MKEKHSGQRASESDHLGVIRTKTEGVVGRSLTGQCFIYPDAGQNVRNHYHNKLYISNSYC